MAKPCFQDQIKDFPWTPERVASLYKEVRDDFINKGVTDFSEIVKGLSARHGLRPEIIVKGLSRPEKSLRSVTDDVWLRAQHSRLTEQQARTVVRQMDKPYWKQKAAQILNIPRRTVLFGHFAAFTKSHLSDQLFYNPKVYAQNLANSWALLTKGGRAAHEARLTEILNNSDPDYVLAKRSGLNVGQGAFVRETSEVTGKKSGAIGRAVEKLSGPDRVAMAYDELRMSRFKIWKKELAHLSPEERADPTQLKTLASVLNHDTGTTARGNAVARFMFLAPRLFPAQLAHTFLDIPKALFETGLGARWKTAAPAARYVARKTAILVGAQTAILASNQGYYEVTKDKRFKPNLSDLRSDLFRPRLFGYSIPISPTVELAKLPLLMIGAGIAARKGDNRSWEMIKKGVEAVMGRQNPLFTILEEAVSGQVQYGADQYNQPTPYPGLLGRAKGKPETWTEYFGQKMPIPFSNYLREFNDELKGQGLLSADRTKIMKSLTAGTIELLTSYHLSPEHPPGKRKPPELKDLPVVKQLIKH